MGRKKIITMKRLVLIFVVMLLSCVGMLAQETVAVYVAVNEKEDTKEEKDAKKVFGAKFVEAIVKRGEYKAVERTASFLEQLSKETSYQQSGAVSDNRLSEIGKQLGADLVCAIDICSLLDEKFISARLISTETAEIFKASSINCDWNSVDQLTSVASRLASNLIASSEFSGPKRIQINGQKYMIFPDDSGKHNWSEAKSLCKSLVAFGKDDWYLPSKSELDGLYKNRETVGGFVEQWYWSSSDADNGNAWIVNFVGGMSNKNDKSREGLVRCVRKY